MKKTIDTTTVGGRIKARRVEVGISQEKLSEKLGIKQNTLSNYENGIHDVPIEILSNLSKILDSSPTYFVWGTLEEKGWKEEVTEILARIRNPKIRKAAIKQLMALSEIDAAV